MAPLRWPVAALHLSFPPPWLKPLVTPLGLKCVLKTRIWCKNVIFCFVLIQIVRQATRNTRTHAIVSVPTQATVRRRPSVKAMRRGWSTSIQSTTITSSGKWKHSGEETTSGSDLTSWVSASNHSSTLRLQVVKSSPNVIRPVARF